MNNVKPLYISFLYLEDYISCLTNESYLTRCLQFLLNGWSCLKIYMYIWIMIVGINMFKNMCYKALYLLFWRHIDQRKSQRFVLSYYKNIWNPGRYFKRVISYFKLAKSCIIHEVWTLVHTKKEELGILTPLDTKGY